jgi:hypothetical protein
MLFAPLAMLFDFDLALNFPLVLAGPVIDALALFALELENIVLTHNFTFVIPSKARNLARMGVMSLAFARDPSLRSG